MKILIVNFSGTGNTKRISEVIRDGFRESGHDCELVPMEDITLGRTSPDPDAWDLIGLGFPVHAMDAPRIVYDFIGSLSPTSRGYFLFKTAGSPFLHGGSTWRIRHALAALGWRLCHEQLYVMPPNAFGFASPSKVLKRFNRCRDLALRSVAEICSGYRRIMPEAPLRTACYAFASLEKQGARNASRRWTVNDACIACGLCARSCPAANISMLNHRPQFSDKCLLCLRCWWHCPTRAIGHRIFHPFFLKAPYELPEGEHHD